MEKIQETTFQTSVLTPIGVYNTKVSAYLADTTLDTITTHALKIFKDNAKRNKLDDFKYNKAVEAFNTRHGMLLYKKGIAHAQKSANTYTYINFPYLNKAGMKSAMDNYRKYVYLYNTSVVKENKAIRKYNKTLVLPGTIEIRQLAKLRQLKQRSTKLFAREYNRAIEALGKELKANYLPKRPIQTIKYSTEIVFNVLVGFYIAQLKERNTYLSAIGSTTRVLKKELPKLKIDHRKLATHKISSIPRLGFCKKTAQNHVKRLREAGILINYVYRNQNKPISVNFNPEIVTVLEGKFPKSKLTTNQTVNVSSKQKLPHNNDSILVLKRKEIKDCENFTVGKICGSVSKVYVSPAEGYWNTTWISETKKKSPRENSATIRKLLPDFLKTAPKKQGTNSVLTRNFLARHTEEGQLAKELAMGLHDDYKGLSRHYLRKIAQYANVTTEEFRAVLVQDFIKSSAKIWKHHDRVYVGSWKNAINGLTTSLFQGITHKENLIEKVSEYRWKLEFARKWFAKKQHAALYPSLYFDTIRKSTNSIGFFGLHGVWLTHLKYKQKRVAQEKISQAKESANRRKKSAKQKLNNAIQAYSKGKYTAKQFYNYVQNNLPHEFLKDLKLQVAQEKKISQKKQYYETQN